MRRVASQGRRPVVPYETRPDGCSEMSSTPHAISGPTRRKLTPEAIDVHEYDDRVPKSLLLDPTDATGAGSVFIFRSDHSPI